jgi:hypothetical protein
MRLVRRDLPTIRPFLNGTINEHIRTTFKPWRREEIHCIGGPFNNAPYGINCSIKKISHILLLVVQTFWIALPDM